MIDQEIKNLEDKISKLTAWKDSRSIERLKYPIDVISRRTLDKGLMIPTGKIISINLALAASDLTPAFEISVNGQKRYLITSFILNQFTANPATDTLTNVAGNHNLQNGDRILFTTDNTLPAGLGFITYYVINRTGTTFKVSATLGGSAINITDTGTGTFFWGQIIFNIS